MCGQTNRVEALNGTQSMDPIHEKESQLLALLALSFLDLMLDSGRTECCLFYVSCLVP